MVAHAVGIGGTLTCYTLVLALLFGLRRDDASFESPLYRHRCVSTPEWVDAAGDGCDALNRTAWCDAPYSGARQAFDARYVGSTARTACCACGGSRTLMTRHRPPISNVVVQIDRPGACVLGFPLDEDADAEPAWRVGDGCSASSKGAIYVSNVSTFVDREARPVKLRDASTGSPLDPHYVGPPSCAHACWMVWGRACHETRLTLRTCDATRPFRYEAPQFVDCAVGGRSPRVCLPEAGVRVEMRDLWGDGWNGGVVVCERAGNVTRFAMERGHVAEHRFCA